MTTRIMVGDCREVMAGLPNNWYHVCVTSPPYWNLRSYLDLDDPAKALELGAEETPELYVQHMVEVFREVWRVLRTDGTVWLNLGDSYSAGGGNRDNGSQGSTSVVGHTSPEACPDQRGKSGLPSKQLIGIPWRVALALQADGWWLRSDIIWCLSGGTRVYARSQKGDMPMTIEDMVRLDPATVKLWNGEKWTQCVSWTENPRPGAPIEIELRSGERIGCTPSHLWPTQRGNVRADALRLGDVIQTTRLPSPRPVKSPEFIPDHIGWFVGLYLAEGSRSNDTIQFAGHIKEKERFHALQRIAKQYGGTCAMHQTSENSATINLHGHVLRGILDTYISGRIAGDKHLSMECWKRSNDFLWKVLRGYLDGDGHYDVKNDRWRLGFTRNYNLENDLRTLCARLGVQLRLKLAEAKYQNGTCKTFRGEIRFTQSQHPNTKESGEVMRIGRSRARKFWDIAVEDDPHLFALASGILTHNSKPNCMPESVTDRPTKSHEYVFLLTKRARYFFDADAVREPHARLWNPDTLGGNLSSGEHKRQGELRNQSRKTPTPNPAGRNIRTVWTIPTRSFRGAHFATFPPALVAPCIKAGSSEQGCCPECGGPWERVVERARWGTSGSDTAYPEGMNASNLSMSRQFYRKQYGTEGPPPAITTGWRPSCRCNFAYPGVDLSPDDLAFVPYLPVPCRVLDPFGGAGTVALVARQLGRDCDLIELNASYAQMAQQRLDATPVHTVETDTGEVEVQQISMFSEVIVQ